MHPAPRADFLVTARDRLDLYNPPPDGDGASLDAFVVPYDDTRRDVPPSFAAHAPLVKHEASDASAKHKRSRTGCLTCRKRKKRCDELKPCCKTCQRLALECVYPDLESGRRPRPRKRSPAHHEQAPAPAPSPEQHERSPVATSPYIKSENSPGYSPTGAGADDVLVSPGAQRVYMAELDHHYRGAEPELPAQPAHAMVANAVHAATMPANNMPANLMPANPMPANPMPANPVPANPMPANPMPANTMPVHPTAVDTMPANLMPAHTAPANPMSANTMPAPYLQQGTNLSPPSLEQDTDYYKHFSSHYVDQGRGTLFHDANIIKQPSVIADADLLKEADLIRDADLTLSPTMCLLSPTSPFASLGSAHLPVQLDPHFLPREPVMLDELQPPTTKEFRAAYPDLDATAFELLEYFQSQQAHIRSVSPLRCFRSVALLFSLHSRTNLFGLLSWTAWHRGSKYVAQKYFHLASEQLEQNAAMSKEELLVALLVLTSAKISSGHSESWPRYLGWASNLLKRHGGVSSFMETEISRWLLLHFAYLDILSVTSSTTPKLLSASDFEFIFRRPPSHTMSESLCSCCEPLLLLIEQVNELSRGMRVAHSTGESLEELYNTAHVIEEQTWAMQPVTDKIAHLSAAEQRLQIRQFDAFKLVTVLHLYQSALCMNAAATPIQVLARRLLRAIDDLIDSNVAGMLVFPLFILGLNLSNAAMRQQLLQHFDRLFLRIHTRSVERVKNLLLKVWQLDQSGARHVDWTELIDQRFDFRCG